MIDDEHLAAGLVFGGLDSDEESRARDRESADPEFARLVAGFAETAALLARSDRPDQPSDSISARILAIPEKEQPEDVRHAPLVALDQHRSEVSRWKHISFALGAVGAAASAAFAVMLVNAVDDRAELREEVASIQSEQADLNRLMTAEDLTIAEASLPGDERATITVMASVDEGLVRVQTANVTIPEGQDMQMWLISDDGAEPMGLIDTADPRVESLPIPDSAELGFTMEPAGGSDELDGPPVVSVKL